MPRGETAVAQDPSRSEPNEAHRFVQLLRRADEQWLGDLDGMLERGRIRVLIPYNRTTLFLDAKGQPRGFELELFREYAKAINEGRSRRLPRLEVVIVPAPHDRLLTMLAAGRGDIAAGLLTISADRHPEAAFTAPYLEDVAEVVVAHGAAPPVGQPEDLSGREVLVAAGTAYHLSLEALNERLDSAGLKPVRIRTGEYLETEDVLQLVDSGVVQYTIADDYLASLWKHVYENLRVEPVRLRQQAALGWAVRRSSPELQNHLDQFLRRNRKGTLLGNILYQRYFESQDWLTVAPTDAASHGRLGELIPLFRKYGEQYELDWVMLLAIAYKESRLRPDLKSRAGAVGLMQIRPETAASLGFNNPVDPDENVHAATRYLLQLHQQYFAAEAHLQPTDVIDLILASYNAGPARIRKLRQTAASRGLDPNRWFDNVEVVARDEIGRETVEYVTGVNNFYVALSQVRDTLLARHAEMERLQTGR